MLKLRRTVFCFAHGEEVGVGIVVLYGRRVKSAFLLKYDRPKRDV